MKENSGFTGGRPRRQRREQGKRQGMGRGARAGAARFARFSAQFTGAPGNIPEEAQTCRPPTSRGAICRTRNTYRFGSKFGKLTKKVAADTFSTFSGTKF